ncbi:hypothetical protein BJX70DRAFT_365247 [Aspergillus crustosus]
MSSSSPDSSWYWCFTCDVHVHINWSTGRCSHCGSFQVQPTPTPTYDEEMSGIRI